MRHSKPTIGRTDESHKLYSTQKEKADLESRNGLLQFDYVVRIIEDSNGTLALTPDIIKRLHLLTIKDIYTCAGNFRDGAIGIMNSNHQPPHADQVPVLVDKMCEYANQHQGDAIHVAAYLMWRINWVHPFSGGNGRTSRAVSYLALSVSLNLLLPGSPTIPDQIMAHRDPYYEALEAADTTFACGDLDLGLMEGLISALLEKQLGSGHGP